MKVLLRQSHWPTSTERNVNESANDDSHSESHITMESQNSRRNIDSSQRRTFTGNDEKEIVRYIVENKEIGLILGNTLWKKMAQRKVCQGRTWQSLKKHFLKHILPNITKYTFLSVTDRLEFQKQGKTISGSHEKTNSEIKPKSSTPIPHRISLHLTEGSDGAGSSSWARNQSHLEEHRSDRLHRPCESLVSNESSNLERECDRRLPEKLKPFRLSSVHASSESDSDGCDGSRDDQRLDQRLQDLSKSNRATSSHLHHQNKGGSHPRKQGDLQHTEKNKACNIQREQLVINSSDEVDSGSEQYHRAPVVRRTNKEGRQSLDDSSSDDWFVAAGSDQLRGNSKAIRHQPRKLRKRRREEFTMEEEYAILEYLRKHNRFSNTGGNNVWKNMAATEPMGSRHTWHSLRERYLKKIVPNIGKYNMPEEIVRRVKYK